MAAGDAGRKDHFIANVDALGQRANRGDFARNIAARHERKRKCDPMEALANPEVEMVQGAGAYAHHDFVRPWLGFRDFRELQDFRPAVLGDDDCLHRDAL